MRKLGSLEPVIYFRNHKDPSRPPGYLILAPYSGYPTPPGYSREYADSLPAVDKLQRALQDQERRAAEAEFIYDESTFGRAVEAIRDKLRQRMTSVATTPYERDFIEQWLKLKDQQKRDKYANIFHQRQCYLWARENDSAKNRRADEERVDVERIG